MDRIPYIRRHHEKRIKVSLGALSPLELREMSGPRGTTSPSFCTSPLTSVGYFSVAIDAVQAKGLRI